MPLHIRHGGRTQWPSRWRWQPRLETWNDFDLWMVRTGRGRLGTPVGTFPISTGDVFVLRPHERYTGHADVHDPASILWLHFDWRDSRGRLSPPPILPALHRRVDDPRFFASLMERCLQHLHLDADRDHATIWLAAALDELDRQDRRHAPGSALETQVRDLAERIVLDPAAFPDVAACAETCRVSERHFSRIFNRCFGTSPQRWIIAQRLTKARLLLREGTQPIKQIADLLGYHDLAFFGRQFRQHCGTTPAAYRRSGHANP